MASAVNGRREVMDILFWSKKKVEYKTIFPVCELCLGRSTFFCITYINRYYRLLKSFVQKISTSSPRISDILEEVSIWKKFFSIFFLFFEIFHSQPLN